MNTCGIHLIADDLSFYFPIIKTYFYFADPLKDISGRRDVLLPLNQMLKLYTSAIQPADEPSGFNPGWLKAGCHSMLTPNSVPVYITEGQRWSQPYYRVLSSPQNLVTTGNLGMPSGVR